MENSMGDPQRTEKRTTIWPSNSNPWYISEESETLNQKDICTPTVITGLFTTVKICKQPKRPLYVLCLVAQICLTLCNPVDCSPPGSSVHGASPGKNTGVGCQALLQVIFPTQGSSPGHTPTRISHRYTCVPPFFMMPLLSQWRCAVTSSRSKELLSTASELKDKGKTQLYP